MCIEIGRYDRLSEEKRTSGEPLGIVISDNQIKLGVIHMTKKTMGIHHITAIVGHPQENVDFYAGVLGLRLVKKTVNFDDPGTYHLYFGDEGGKPGTIITFFP